MWSPYEDPIPLALLGPLERTLGSLATLARWFGLGLGLGLANPVWHIGNARPTELIHTPPSLIRQGLAW
jgi:hypothetical protein